MAKSDDGGTAPKPGEVRTDLGSVPAEFSTGSEILGGDTSSADAAAEAAITAELGPAVSDLGPAPIGDVDAFGDEIDIEPRQTQPATQPAARPDAAQHAKAVTDPFSGVDTSLVQAAQGMGLSDLQIEQTINQMGPEAASTVFERYHSQIVSEASLAQSESGMMPGFQGPSSPPLGFVPTLGQPGQPAQSVLPGPQQVLSAANQAPVSTTGQPAQQQPLFAEDVKAKLREGLGQTEADTLIASLEASNASSQTQIQAIQQQIALSQQAAKKASDTQRLEQVNGELTRLGSQGADNADYYGQDAYRATPEQKSRRARTINLAGAIATSHAQRGTPITMELAVNRAHLVETASDAKRAGMEQVRADVVKRHKAVTMPPTGPGAGVRRQANPDDEAIQAITATWSKHGIQV